MRRALLVAAILLSLGLIGNYTVGDGGWRGWIADGNGSRFEFYEQTVNPNTTAGTISLFFRNLAGDPYPYPMWDDQEATTLGRQFFWGRQLMEMVVGDSNGKAADVDCLTWAGHGNNLALPCTNSGPVGYIPGDKTAVFHQMNVTLLTVAGATHDCSIYFAYSDDLTNELTCTDTATCIASNDAIIPITHVGTDDPDGGGAVVSLAAIGDGVTVSLGNVEITGGDMKILSAQRRECSGGSTIPGNVCFIDADCPSGTCDAQADNCDTVSMTGITVEYSLYE